MDDAPPSLTPSGPPPDPPVERVGVNATIASWLALVVGAIASAGLLLLAVGLSLCGLFGETCTPEEERQASLALLGAGVTFFGVPALVAVVRRDARWFYAPFVEAIAVGLVLIAGAVV